MNLDDSPAELQHNTGLIVDGGVGGGRGDCARGENSGGGMGGRTLRKRSWLFVAMAMILAIPVLLVASAPKMEVSWKNPNFSGTRFSNILVLALNGKAASRAEFEDELAAA